ncbi:DUF317 domain-containing protein [Streptomyces hokutonensis]|uniref:DUF317 domain-containing protein n=1 Tax=Streptomyces hokutonensis TaxID=1306990 RepID=UPI00381D6801
MTGFAPADRVLVSPRHLAGGGLDGLGHVLGPLIHLFGWHRDHDTRTGHVLLDSPCHSLFVDCTPSSPDGIWWRISHHEPYWEAHFSARTPTEAIAAVTQALPQFLGDDRHAERIPVTTSSLGQIADLNGWKMASDGHATAFASADGYCALTHVPDAEIRWRVRHSLRDAPLTDWTATFTRAAPTRLVAQFFAHLTSTIPVERVFGDLPVLVRHDSHAVITPVRDAAVNPHVHHTVVQAAHAHQPPSPARRTPTASGRR